MSVFEKIKKQQPKERTAVWMVGEQLADIIRDDPLAQELVDHDLDIKEMSLAECEKKIHAFADKHRTGGFACVIPAEAEKIIREFYGIPDTPHEAPAHVIHEWERSSKTINLSDFF